MEMVLMQQLLVVLVVLLEPCTAMVAPVATEIIYFSMVVAVVTLVCLATVVRAAMDLVEQLVSPVLMALLLV